MFRCFALLLVATSFSGRTNSQERSRETGEAARVGDPAPEKITGSDYYPLQVGTSWEYLVNGNRINIRVARHEKFQGVMCALLETSTNGKVAATEHISLGKGGMYRHSMLGQKVEPPVLFMKFPIKNGQSWKIEAKIGNEELKVEYTWGKEEITVPAGKYKAVTVKTNTFLAGGQKITATMWYAKNVGMVKTFMTIEGNRVELELDKFTPAK